MLVISLPTSSSTVEGSLYIISRQLVHNETIVMSHAPIIVIQGLSLHVCGWHNKRDYFRVMSHMMRNWDAGKGRNVL